MTSLIISSIPVFILIFFGRIMPNALRSLTAFLCIPFAVILAFYSLILGGAIVIALIIIFKILEYKAKKINRQNDITVI